MSGAAIPNLYALHCFDVTARAGTFTAAARAMCVTHGAISRQVRKLEDDVGVRLLVRGGRRVVPTPEGAALLAATARGFGALTEGLDELRARRGAPFVVSCEPTLLLHWLLPRLGAQEDHVVHVEASGGPPDFERTRIDFAVRRVEFAVDPRLTCEPLMPEWNGLVCSAAYAERLRTRAPRVTLLHTRTRVDAFRAFDVVRRRLVVTREQTFDHFSFSIQAAIAGLGIAVGPFPLVQDAIAARRLVAPFGFDKGPIGYVLLARRPLDGDARALAFRAWLRRHAKRARPPKAMQRLSDPAPASAPE